MTAQEYTERTNRLETEIDRLNQARIALLADIVECLSKVIDAIPTAD